MSIEDRFRLLQEYADDVLKYVPEVNADGTSSSSPRDSLGSGDGDDDSGLASFLHTLGLGHGRGKKSSRVNPEDNKFASFDNNTANAFTDHSDENDDDDGSGSQYHAGNYIDKEKGNKSSSKPNLNIVHTHSAAVDNNNNNNNSPSRGGARNKYIQAEKAGPQIKLKSLKFDDDNDDDDI